MAKKKPITVVGEKVVLNGVRSITMDEQLQQLVVAAQGMKYRIDYKTRITINEKSRSLCALILLAAQEQKVAIW